MSIKAFIFDFDGLIIDTETIIFKSWLEIYKRHNIELPQSMWELIIGSSNHDFDPLDYLLQHVSIEINKSEFLANFMNSILEKTKALPLLPGVQKYLEWAKKNKIYLGLASSSPNHWVSTHLEKLGIYKLFDVIRTSDDVEMVKPNPDLFLSVKNYLNLHDNEAIVFEDSPNGIKAANKAGFFTIAVPNAMTKNMDFSEADFILNNLNAVNPQNLVKILENNLKTSIV